MILTLFVNISPERDLFRRKKNYLSREPSDYTIFSYIFRFCGVPQENNFFLISIKNGFNSTIIYSEFQGFKS